MWTLQGFVFLSRLKQRFRDLNLAEVQLPLIRAVFLQADFLFILFVFSKLLLLKTQHT